MAELLVRAKGHWMDSLTDQHVGDRAVAKYLLANLAASSDDLAKARASAVDDFNSRSQIGDVIVVRPDGWQWGKEECLPNFIVVKMPEMTFDEAKKYEDPLVIDVLIEGELIPKTLKRRKYKIPLSDVEEAKNSNGVLHRSKEQKIKNIIEKTE